MANYLDENGLARLWSRIQQLVYECGCNLGYKCINDNVETDECFERAVNSVIDKSELASRATVYTSTSMPDGKNGDLWVKYTEGTTSETDLYPTALVEPGESISGTYVTNGEAIVGHGVDGGDGITEIHVHLSGTTSTSAITRLSGGKAVNLTLNTSGIPQDAVINSVKLRAKARMSNSASANTSGKGVTSRIALYDRNGNIISTAIVPRIVAETTEVEISGLTREQLEGSYIRANFAITASWKATTSVRNVTAMIIGYLYGVELEVNYSVNKKVDGLYAKIGEWLPVVESEV